MISAPSHWHTRCRERGITSTDCDVLYNGIKWAIENGRDDLVERAKSYKESVFWRFRCPDGIFYTITDRGKTFPKTVYTQEMYKNTKASMKFNIRKSRRPGNS